MLQVVRNLERDSEKNNLNEDENELQAQINKEGGEEETTWKNIEFAASLMAECNSVVPLTNLDTAVLQFRQVLETPPITDSTRCIVMGYLVAALSLRFMYTNQINDLDESIYLRCDLYELRDDMKVNNTMVVPLDHPNPDLEDKLRLAKASFTDFQISPPLSNLSTAISILRTSLSNLGQESQAAHRIMALTTLADALYTRFHRSSEVSDLYDAISNLQNAVNFCSSSEMNSLVPHITRRLCTMWATRFDLSGDLDDLHEGLSQFQAASPSTAANEISEDEAPIPPKATRMYEEFLESGNVEYLDISINLFREAVQRIAEGSNDEYDSTVLNNLGIALGLRFEQTGRQGDIDEGISVHKQALQLLSPTHSRYSGYLLNLADSLLARFKNVGQEADLADAISLHREALDLRPPSHIGRSNSLNNLANALFVRFGQTGQRGDLDEAIFLHTEALDLRTPPHPERYSSLTNLANTLAARFELTCRPSDFDEAIYLHRQALELIPPYHAYRSIILKDLASALAMRSLQGDQHTPSHLDEAISLYKQALELQHTSHPSRPESLNALASSLFSRFEQGNQLSDINEAITLYRDAIEQFNFKSNPNRRGALYNLASALWTRFQFTGQQNDLNESISINRQALELLTTSHPIRSAVLNSLAVSLRTHYETTGRQDDLREAISLHREALELQDQSYPSRSSSLNNLASALVTRYQQGGLKKDLDEAISLHREALYLRPPPHLGQAASLGNLSVALEMRFERTNQKADLEEVIVLRRQTLGLRAPSHPKWPESLSNLASVLRDRYREDGRPDDLEEAISLNRQALDIQDSRHPGRPGLLHNLAVDLSERFERRGPGQQDDLHEAISLYEKAISLYPNTHPNHINSLTDLGNLFANAHLQVGSEKSDYLERAMSSFSSALSQSESASQRFTIAKMWSFYADLHQHPTAMEAYDAALQVLPQLISLGLDIKSRHEALATTSDGLARTAARCAILNGCLDKAVEYLEAGRAVFWSQALHLRSPFDTLRGISPDLGERLHNIAMELERGSHRKDFDETLDNRANMKLEEEASYFGNLNKAWLNGLEEARNLEGLHDFLLPRRISALRAAASDFPIVFLVPNSYCSDCLIFTSTVTHHISLSRKLSTDELQKLVNLIQSAASNSSNPRSLETDDISTLVVEDIPQDSIDTYKDSERSRLGAKRYRNIITSDSIFRSVLRVLWDEVVKPVIDYLGIEKREGATPTTRLLWCATGLFTFLPIHAAGRYEDPLISESAHSYILSSYIPTIELLLSQEDSRAGPTVPRSKFKMLAVVDTKRLHSAKTELEKIKARVPSDYLIQFGTPSSPALVETIFGNLPSASIVHFACHGKQDRSNPLNSALLVDDGELMISKIMQQPLPNGAVAFLCACETAMGNEDLPDEAMSLGASILFSGFRNVIATMWRIADADGPTIADAFYEKLFQLGFDRDPTSCLDVGESVQALDTAIRVLRSKGVEFRRWVPFIHLGK